MYANNAKSRNTLRAYASDLRCFRGWCRAHALSPLPASPQTVVLFVTWCAQRYKVSTIERRLASIAHAHASAGHSSPVSDHAVRSVLRGIRRAKGTRQTPKAALHVEDLRRIVASIDDARLVGLRDRALLLLGFASALRRSELVALDVDDLHFEPEGVVLTVRRSKTDAQGRSAHVAVPYSRDPAACPVRALSAWLRGADLTAGPVFRGMCRGDALRPTRLSARMVAAILKRRAGAAGLDTTHLAAHSLRSGFATAAARVGRDERSIMQHTRHRSVRVARRYIRQGTIWANHPGTEIGI